MSAFWIGPSDGFNTLTHFANDRGPTPAGVVISNNGPVSLSWRMFGCDFIGRGIFWDYGTDYRLAPNGGLLCSGTDYRVETDNGEVPFFVAYNAVTLDKARDEASSSWRYFL